MLRSSHFSFLVTFGPDYENMYYVKIFVHILQVKMGKTEKNQKENPQQKWPKYQKPKDEDMGWTEQ